VIFAASQTTKINKAVSRAKSILLNMSASFGGMTEIKYQDGENRYFVPRELAETWNF
jgi:hypothetical protein